MLFRFFIIVLLFTSTSTFANQFYGSLQRVVTPNTLIINVDSQRYIRLTLLGPDFGADANQSCQFSQSNKEKCNLLSEIIDGKMVGVIVEEVQEDKMFGDIVVDESPLSLTLVLRGHYRVDHKHNLSHALLIAESEARCQYKGIWEKYKGQYEVAKSCMGS